MPSTVLVLVCAVTVVVVVALDSRRRVDARADRHRLTQLRQQLDIARRQARTDPLTGLPNRLALTEALRDAADHGLDLQVVVLDLDDLHQINAATGHTGGDHALQALAAHLGDVARSTDTTATPADQGHCGPAPAGLAARLGGDEFALLLPDRVDPRRALELLDVLLRQSLAEQPDRPHPTVSAGWASTHHHPLQPGSDRPEAQVLAAADTALYAAKTTRHNHPPLTTAGMVTATGYDPTRHGPVQVGDRTPRRRRDHQPCTASTDPH